MDPKQIWQSQQSDSAIDDLLKQAKRRQAWMATLMILDVLAWVGAVIMGAIIIKNNAQPSSFATGLFLIFYTSIAVAYMGYIRMSTWGAASLSPKALVQLSIKRAQVGAKLVNITYPSFVAATTSIFLIQAIGNNAFVITTLLIQFLIAFLVIMVACGEWYRRKQNKLAKTLTARLAEFDVN